MDIPVNIPDSVHDFKARKRCISDLIFNAHSKEYCNERGFKQKLIENLYKLGYYKDNESIFISKEN